jgi:uncharacterized protein YbbC (DUF1343 family)
MALSMQAAARKGIPFVVLDRPNPIGGDIVEGALLDPAFASFIGMYPIPARHGMTVGELATLFNRQQGIGADLTVVPAQGWRRGQWFDQTGLPWVNPSPNLRSLAAVTSYPGTVYVEGTNLSEGRGTDRPFEQIGAPWLDAAAVAATMNTMGLPGIAFQALTVTVADTAAKFPGQSIPAIRLTITDRQAYRPVRTALLALGLVSWSWPIVAWCVAMRSGVDREARELGALDAERWLDRLARAWREDRAALLVGMAAIARPGLVAAKRWHSQQTSASSSRANRA